MDENMPQLAFLLYDSRSGSTLLASLLNQHPDVAVSFEAEFLVSAMAYKGKKGVFPENKLLFEMLKTDKRLAEWGIDVETLFKDSMDKHLRVTIKTIISTLMRYLQKQFELKAEQSLVIVKQGLLSGYLDNVLFIWPNAKIIHIYRDGRAVYASKKHSKNIDTNLPMSDDPYKSALRWMRIQNQFKNTFIGSRLIEIRYEDLIMETKKTLDLVLAFGGLDPSRYPEKKSTNPYAENLPEKQRSIHLLVGKPVESSRITAWQSTISLFELWTYERSAHAVLAGRQYKPVFYSFLGFYGFLKYRMKKLIFDFKSRVITWIKKI
jgi:Sulfotransferase family